MATETKLACVGNNASFLRAKWGKCDVISSEPISTAWFFSYKLFISSSGTLGSFPHGEDGLLLSSQSSRARTRLPQACALSESSGISVVEVSQSIFEPQVTCTAVGTSWLLSCPLGLWCLYCS